jgi:hypothetical protein
MQPSSHPAAKIVPVGFTDKHHTPPPLASTRFYTHKKFGQCSMNIPLSLDKDISLLKQHTSSHKVSIFHSVINPFNEAENNLGLLDDILFKARFRSWSSS